MADQRLGISKQGSVATGGGIIYQVTSGYRGFVHDIKFNNTSLAAYHLTVSLHRAATSSLIQLYYMELDAGDTVTDAGMYELFDGDYLYAQSNVSGTVFTMNGIELFDTTAKV